MSVCGQFFQMESSIMQEHRIVKTLETVLARFTCCELFLARFYDARLQEFQYFIKKELFLARFYDARLREFQYFIKKKLKFVSVCKVCSVMQELRIVKTLETVLARGAVCFFVLTFVFPLSS